MTDPDGLCAGVCVGTAIGVGVGIGLTVTYAAVEERWNSPEVQEFRTDTSDYLGRVKENLRFYSALGIAVWTTPLHTVNQEEINPVDDLKDRAQPGKPTKGKTTNWDFPGAGMPEADKDFDDLADPDTVEPRGDGVRTGQLPDGREINVRPGHRSTDGRPTVDVTTGNKHDKFRYGDKEEVKSETQDESQNDNDDSHNNENDNDQKQ